jgi:TFIIF-interacting CTD phosphatase-like protein
MSSKKKTVRKRSKIQKTSRVSSRSTKSPKRLNVLLDLDDTLMHSVPSKDYDMTKNKKKLKKLKFHDMDGYYLVFERPGVQEFLDKLFKNFNVSVWTAATKDYAVFVIDKIILKKPERKLDYVFFSYHCDLSEKHKKGVKDLSTIWDIFKIPGYTKENTIIIDDLDEVHSLQPKKCLQATPFNSEEEGSENDDYLKQLSTHLSKISSDPDQIEGVNKTLTPK